MCRSTTTLLQGANISVEYLYVLPDGWAFFAHERQPVRTPLVDGEEPFVFVAERPPVRAPVLTRVAAGALAFLAAISVALAPIPATAVEIPAPPSAF